jgi:monovalent cation:H+ antiporter-2, CPA2 family
MAACGGSASISREAILTDPTEFLAHLAVALLVGGVAGVIAARLGQSVILGYIVAGVLIGPHTPGWIADQGTVTALANIGIVLLLFVTGMDISPRDFLSFRKVVVGGGLAQVMILIGIGYGVGIALGWSPVAALFLGAVVSNSSSTVMAKVLAERGEVASRHGRISIAWSSVQDLSTVVLVVLLTGVAVEGNDILRSLVVDVLRASVFLVIVGPLGSFLLPRLFESLRALGQQEVFVLAAATLAILTAYTATLFGLSEALGAFIAGVVLSESDIRHEVLNGIRPLRDVFAALFFVSIGMFIEPMFVIENLLTVLVVLTLIVVVKGTLSALLARLFGLGTRRSVLVGGALAQSAEFSFLLASLGLGLAALNETEFSAILSATAISTVLASGILAAVTPLSRRLERVERSDLTIAPSASEQAATLEDHAIVCGHGRVGQVVTRALLAQGCPVAVIDLDPTGVVELRQQGIPAYMGTADNEALLELVGIRRANLLVIAVPERMIARRVSVLARQLNPSIRIVARTHEESERLFLEQAGVDEALFGELELALEMARYALHASGVELSRADDYVDRLRHGER